MFSEAQIHKMLIDRFPGQIGQLTQLGPEESHVRIKPEALHPVCEFLLRTRELHFDFLRHILLLPGADRITMVYYLFSFEHGHQIAIRIDLPKNTQQMLSVADLWGGADQLEAEIHERLGVSFAVSA